MDVVKFPPGALQEAHVVQKSVGTVEEDPETVAVPEGFHRAVD